MEQVPERARVVAELGHGPAQQLQLLRLDGDGERLAVREVAVHGRAAQPGAARDLLQGHGVGGVGEGVVGDAQDRLAVAERVAARRQHRWSRRRPIR